VLGRETAIQPMCWGSDGWLRTERGDAEPDPAPLAPSLRPSPWPTSEWDGRFDGSELPLEFQWLRTPEPDDLFSLQARRGWLRLWGRESIGSHFRQSLVARRQEHFRFTATTRLEYSPEDFQQAAGLVYYYNSTKFHYLHVTADGGARQLQLLSAQASEVCTGEIAVSALPDGAIELRAIVDNDVLRFAWRADADPQWQMLPLVLDASMLSDEVTVSGLPNFTGSFVGMACQDVSGAGIPADFEWFRYEGRDGEAVEETAVEGALLEVR
jgi:xylan 1,4-beta-xylosidase